MRHDWITRLDWLRCHWITRLNWLSCDCKTRLDWLSVYENLLNNTTWMAKLWLNNWTSMKVSMRSGWTTQLDWLRVSVRSGWTTKLDWLRVSLRFFIEYHDLTGQECMVMWQDNLISMMSWSVYHLLANNQNDWCALLSQCHCLCNKMRILIYPETIHSIILMYIVHGYTDSSGT